MTELKALTRRRALAAFAMLAAAPLSATAALSQSKKQDRLDESGRDGHSTSSPDKSTQDKFMTLFKIVTVRDDIIIGLDQSELAKLGGSDAGAVARALAAQGAITVWQYGVRRGPDNAPQQVPTQKIGILASASLRVEPYTSAYPVLAHD